LAKKKRKKVSPPKTKPRARKRKEAKRNFWGTLFGSAAPAKSKRLGEKARELELKLSQSVPREQFDSLRKESEAKNKKFMEKIAELESKLSLAIPKAEQVLETQAKNVELASRVAELESKLSHSVPRTELEATKAESQARLQELNARLREKLPTEAGGRIESG